jgi:hypothetical protein
VPHRPCSSAHVALAHVALPAFQRSHAAALNKLPIVADSGQAGLSKIAATGEGGSRFLARSMSPKGGDGSYRHLICSTGVCNVT